MVKHLYVGEYAHTVDQIRMTDDRVEDAGLARSHWSLFWEWKTEKGATMRAGDAADARCALASSLWYCFA